MHSRDAGVTPIFRACRSWCRECPTSTALGCAISCTTARWASACLNATPCREEGGSAQ